VESAIIRMRGSREAGTEACNEFRRLDALAQSPPYLQKPPRRDCGTSSLGSPKALAACRIRHSARRPLLECGQNRLCTNHFVRNSFTGKINDALIVFSRCAMTRSVELTSSWRMVDCSFASVSTSTLLVASSWKQSA